MALKVKIKVSSRPKAAPSPPQTQPAGHFDASGIERGVGGWFTIYHAARVAETLEMVIEVGYNLVIRPDNKHQSTRGTLDLAAPGLTQTRL